VIAAHASLAALGAAPRPPTDAEFAKFRALIERETGIHLSDAKRALLTARLVHRVRELGLTTFGAYLQRVVADDPELVQMIDRITTNETCFFREPHHFEVITRHAAPRWIAAAHDGARPRRVSAWSAGCSTGEEPYSLAIALRAALPAGWEISILATDLSTRALARARGAIYPIERADGIPAELRAASLLRGVGEQRGNVKIAPEVRERVRFERLNLTTDAYPAGAPLDLILCRNVLIYFSAEVRRRVVERLIARLAPGGLLLLGHAESLPQAQRGLRTVIPTVYQRIDQDGGER
jgi:chemotaxis protein methyltransferase CheR